MVQKMRLLTVTVLSILTLEVNLPINDIQSTFAGGEYAPTIQARTDIQKYKSGLATALNFITHPHGPSYNRPGTTYLVSTKYADRISRLVPFVASTGDAFVLEFGDSYIRFIKDDALVKKEIYDSEIPYWDLFYPYSIGDYVLKLLGSGKTGLFSSLVFANYNHDPESSPTYWNKITEFDLWSSATTYAVGNYCYAIRPADGKHKVFRSLIGSNINNNPFVSVNWNHTPPAAWDASHTYSTGDYITYTDFLGNESVYRSMQNGNLNHSIFDGSWWQFWNGALYWNVLTTYAAGDYVTILDGGGIYRCYQSAVSGNTGHDPLAASSVAWEEIIQANIYEISTPYAQADIANLKFTQSADTLYIAHQGYQPRTLVRNGANDWALSTFEFLHGPFMAQNTDETFGMNENNTGPTGYMLFTQGIPSGTKNYFTDQHIGALFSLRQYWPQQSQLSNITAAGAKPSMKCMDTWRLTTTGTWSGVITIEKSVDDGTTWTTLQTYASSSDANFNVFGNESIGDGIPFLVRMNVTSWTSGTMHRTFTTDAFYQTSIMKVSSVPNETQAYVTIENKVKPLQSTVSTQWSEGSWSTYRGWPAVVSFFQDRLCFASTPTEPQTFWASKSGVYVDFGVSSPLVDDDSIGLNLLSRQLNKISSMVMFQNSALCFTDSSEWTITSEQGGAITPTTVFSKLQGYRGSNSLDPVLIGSHLIFVSPRSSSVRDIEYQYLTDTLNSDNLSLFSDHLLDGYQIVSMAYQQEPNSLIWFVRDDGVLLCLTYLREQEMISWSRHTTNGNFESVCSIPGTDGDDLYFIVKRGTNRFIEKMTKRVISTDPADQYFVDCGVSYSGSAVSTITGLERLNGYSVAINAGGFVLPQQVVSGGSVTLGASYTKVHVGLPYTCDLETLKPEVPLQEGSLQGVIYKINQVAIRFLNSRGGYIGTDADNLEPVDQRDESLAATTPTPLFTGFDVYTLPQNNDEHPHVFYRQTDPMPVTIMSITSVINPGDGI